MYRSCVKVRGCFLYTTKSYPSKVDSLYEIQ